MRVATDARPCWWCPLARSRALWCTPFRAYTYVYPPACRLNTHVSRPLADACAPPGHSRLKLAGSVVLPECSLKGNGWVPSPTDTACCHLFTRSNASAPGSAPPAVLAAGDGVPLHRSFDWASALLARFRPQALVVLDAAAAGDGAVRTALARAGALCCVLQTDAAAAALGAPHAPLMPPGPLIGGASAALMTQCQARGVPGRLYVYSPPDRVSTAAEVANALVHAVSADDATLPWSAALSRAHQAGCFADARSGSTFT